MKIKKQRPSHLWEFFADYAEYHRTLGNQITHWVGIPMIMVSLLGGLSHLGQGHLNAGVLFWFLCVIWYLLLDWRLGLPFALVALGIYLAGTLIAPLGLGILFILGWAFQLVGHSVFEKRKPALLTNIRHLLIGPLWLFAKFIGHEYQ